MPQKNLSADLAELVSATRYDDISGHVVDRVKAIIIDALGCAIAGRHVDETTQVERASRAGFGAGDATVIAARTRLSPAGAVFVNSYQLTALTICDVFRPAVFHVSPQVIPPVFTMAERGGASGADVLRAVALGLESSVRIALAANYSTFRARGWHSPGVFGPMGGAVAQGSLMGFDARGLRHALGLAGSQAAGTFASWGTPAIKFHQSRGALSAHLSAMLAAEGFHAADDILTAADGGLLSTYTEGSDTGALTRDWGQAWALEGIALKRWPAVTNLQTMLTAALALAEDHKVDPADIAGVRVELPTAIRDKYGDVGWDTPFLAKLSPRYLAAVALHDRRCWLEQFTPDRLRDEALDAFASDRVTVVGDPALDDLAATVTVTLTNGTTLEDRRMVPKGEPADPLTQREIVEKFREASSSTFSTQHADRIVDEVLRLDAAPDISSLAGLLAGQP